MRKAMTFVLAGVFTAMMSVTAFAGEWKSNGAGWWYDNGNGTWPANTWQWIDGNGDGTAECYYFDQNGYALMNSATPDGYVVNGSGAWTVNGVIQTKYVGGTVTKSDITESPFNQEYWVIFTEGFRGDRVEASSVDSSLPASSLHIIWDSALYLNNTSGSDGYDQYCLDDDDEWTQIGTYVRLTDRATNVIASNLDIYDSRGNLILSKCAYSDVNWNLINSYR